MINAREEMLELLEGKEIKCAKSNNWQKLVIKMNVEPSY